MKLKLLLTTLALCTLAADAQQVSNGFYRVQNYGTKRYAYVLDSSGSIDISNTTADMGAISLDKTPDRRFTDPASVIYIAGKGKYEGYDLYDLEAQGTGVYKIINYYVTVTPSPVAGTYWVYQPTYNMYLCDPVTSTSYPISYISTQGGNAQTRSWSIFPVSANTDEYLGVAPNPKLKVGDKYYKPYYFGFGLDLTSSGMKAYYVTDVKTDAVIIAPITGTIPAATPVIIECSSTAATNNRVNPVYTTPAKISGNRLSGNYFCYADHKPTGYRAYDAKTMRVLSVVDGHLCYVTDTQHTLTTQLEVDDVLGYYINASESYLQVPEGSAATLPVMTQAEYDALHPAGVKGDVNGDGKVSSTDALVLYRYIASGKTAAQAPEADINGDGKVSSTDALVLYRLISAGK